VLTVTSVSAMRELGAAIAEKLRAGDLIVLSGDLGAGKTALTQGIGLAIGINDVTSPTFVISRVHKGKIPLIHVDAYRLMGNKNANFEFDDLDLDTSIKDAITVIEWGDAVAPRLMDEYLLIKIEFGQGESERLVTAIGYGTRWEGFSL
jgi:tRNA threonylcarbamoyladenosine biosynthesis protein TsaE